MPRYLTSSILGSQCIGDSLVIINNNYDALDTVVYALSTNTIAVTSTATTTPALSTSTTSYPWQKILSVNVNDSSITNAKLAFNGGSLGFRNKIINGDMRIDQRNAGNAVRIGNTTDNLKVQIIDRWKAGAYKRDINGALISVNMASATVQQVAEAPVGFTNSLKYTVTQATTPANGDGYWLYYQFEGYNTEDLKYGTSDAVTTTLSFWVKSSIAGKYSGFIRSNSSIVVAPGDQARTYIYTYNVNSANVWEYKTITIPGDTLTGNIPDGGNGTGIHLLWDLGSGPYWNTPTPNAWVGGNYLYGFTPPLNFAYYRTSDSVNLISTVGATFQITGVQFEKGPTATPFEYRPFGTELALCQRYFEKSYNLNTAVGTLTTDGAFIGYPNALNTIYFANPQISFKAEKRAKPSMVSYNTANGSSATFRADGSPGVAEVDDGQPLFESGTKVAYVGSSTTFGRTSYHRIQWTADAEL